MFATAEPKAAHGWWRRALLIYFLSYLVRGGDLPNSRGSNGTKIYRLDITLNMLLSNISRVSFEQINLFWPDTISYEKKTVVAFKNKKLFEKRGEKTRVVYTDARRFDTFLLSENDRMNVYYSQYRRSVVYGICVYFYRAPWKKKMCRGDDWNEFFIINLFWPKNEWKKKTRKL